MDSPLNRSLSRFAAFFLLIVAMVLALYAGSLQLWWCCDDPAILLHAHGYSPWEYFTVPSAWRALVPFSLTPWLSLVYDLDLTLFGFRPEYFYAHQLLSIALCAWLLQRIALQWVDAWCASVASLFFLVGVPVATAAQQLMARQYVEGLLFFLTALSLAIRSLHGGHKVLRPLAMLFFALSATAKEVFLPLGFILLLLPIADFRRRLEVVWPWLLVMLLYVPWRWYMLGSVIGGYVSGAGLQSVTLGEVAGAFATVPAMLWGYPLAAGAGMTLLALMALPRLWHRAWHTMAWLVLLPIMLFAPLLPLVRFPGLSERYFIVPWAAMALMASIALGLAWRNRPFGMRVVLVGAVAMLLGAAWTPTESFIARGKSSQAPFRAVGMAYLENDDSAILWVPSAVPSWFTQSLASLRPAMGLPGAPPRAVSDESSILALNTSVGRLLRYDAATQSMQDVSTAWPQLERQWRSRLDAGNVSVALEYDVAAKLLRWTLSPDTDGSFTYVALDGALAIPSKGQVRMESAPTGCFRILLTRTKGTASYSPLLIWPSIGSPVTVSQVSWEGSGDLFESNHSLKCP